MADFAPDRPTSIYPPDKNPHRRIQFERERNSSGGSASARSRISSGGTASRDYTSTSEESWSEVDYDDDEEEEDDDEDDGEESDDIDPSDSASRLPPRNARPRAPPPPTSRRHIPIVAAPLEEEDDDEEPPQPRRHRHPPRRHDDRPARSSERRLASDESSGTVASHDDYPHGHYGMHRHTPAPTAGFHGLPRTHSGYPPSMTSGGGFSDIPHDARQALVQMQQRDHFAHPQPNPFATHPPQPNPFQPISPNETPNYFASDAHSPPIPHQRPPAPQRPQSFAAPQGYGGELVAPYHAQTLPGHPIGAYPTPWAGYPPFPYQWMQHHQPPPAEKPGRSRSPSSKKSTPPPAPVGPLVLPKDLEMKNHEIDNLKIRLQQQLQVNMKREAMDRQKEAEAMAQKAEAAQAKRDAEQRAIREAELDALKSLIKKHEEDRDAREAAWRKEREAEAAAKAAAIAKAEEEKKRKEEIDAASAKAKDEAEKKAADAAKKADEEYKTKLAEAEKAKEESEKKKKALEEEIEKSKPPPDMTKLPIRFKDAVGRKFSFPWHLCKTWKGMEDLIKQAFAHVDTIGEHVHEGHYDLTGPNGEIILPKVWDSMVQPDWEITMHLWPFEEPKAPEPPKPPDIWEQLGMLGGGPGGLAFASAAPGPAAGPAPPKKKSSGSGKKSGSSSKKKSHPPSGVESLAAAAAMGLPPLNPPMDPINIPPPPPLGAMGPAAGFEGDPFMGIGAFPGPSIPGPPLDRKKKPSSKKKGKEMSALGMWLTGSAPKSKKK